MWVIFYLSLIKFYSFFIIQHYELAYVMFLLSF